MENYRMFLHDWDNFTVTADIYVESQRAQRPIYCDNYKNKYNISNVNSVNNDNFSSQEVRKELN